MLFKSVAIQNFMSIKNINLELDKRGLVLIQGKNRDDDSFESNGSGKTNMIEAILWNLYGKTTKDLKGDDVVHNKAKKNCSVVMDIVDDDGSEYRISRFRKHKDQGNSVLIFKDKKNITPKSEKDCNEFIVDLLQMDYLTFTSSVLYTAKSFRFTSATDKEMKEAFDTMLDFEFLNRCLDIAKAKKTDLQNSLYYLDKTLATVDVTVSNLEEQLETLRQQEIEHKESANRRVKELTAELKGIQDEYKKFVKSQTNHSDKLEKLNDELSDVNEQIDSFSDMTEQLNDLRAEAKSIAIDISQHEKTIKSDDRKVVELKNKIKDSSMLIGTKCPVCKSLVTEDTLSDVIEELKSEIKTITNNMNNEAKLIKSCEVDKKNLEDLIEKVVAMLEEVKPLKATKEKLRTEISDINAQVKQSNTMKKQYELRITSTKASIDNQKESANKTFKESIRKVQEQIQNTKDSKIEQENERKSKLEELKAIDFWINAYGNQGIKSYLLDDVTPFLNERVNYYIQKLASSTIEIDFSTQSKLKSGETRDKFSVNVKNLKGGESYKSNSGGEQKRIDIAINMALQDLVAGRSNKKLNIVWYDEAFDALDGVGVEKVIELLQENSESKSSIFVTTHNDELKSHFSNTIIVEKSGGYSHLLES